MKKVFKISAVLIVVFLLGWYASEVYKGLSPEERISQIRENSLKYKYINPLIFIDNSNIVYEELNPLQNAVSDYINTEVNNNNANKIAVYYRDLNSGIWTGVNPDEKFVPASILKVLTLMVYLRVAESDEAVMQKKLFYQKNPNEKQNYPPTSELENGYYSVSRLLGQALIESDNAAAVALLQVREKEFNELYATLRLPAKPVKLDDYMSPREVSRIFRSLYSSTYLLDSYSEQALQFLVETHFNDGLTQGVPEEIEIANKFGEHTVYYANNKESPDYELHDCGIVYYPKKPYFICVMTKGKNLESLENIIKEISSKTFEFVKEAEF